MEEASAAAATISARISKREHDDDDDDDGDGDADDDDYDDAVTNHSLVCNMLEKPTNPLIAENIQFNGCCLPSSGLASFRTRPSQRRSL